MPAGGYVDVDGVGCPHGHADDGVAKRPVAGGFAARVRVAPGLPVATEGVTEGDEFGAWVVAEEFASQVG